MWLLRVRLTTRAGQTDSSVANKMGSAVTAEKGQIRNSDKGPVTWAVSKLWPKERAAASLPCSHWACHSQGQRG